VRALLLAAATGTALLLMVPTHTCPGSINRARNLPIKTSGRSELAQCMRCNGDLLWREDHTNLDADLLTTIDFTRERSLG